MYSSKRSGWLHCIAVWTIPTRGNFRMLCPCVRWKFVDWDILAAMLGLLGVTWAKSVSINRITKKDNYHGEGYCVCCLNYKRKEVEGCELKLHRLTADKKLRKVRWLLLSETGQKSDSMFATIICIALFKTVLFTLFRTVSFSILMPLKTGVGVYI